MTYCRQAAARAALLLLLASLVVLAAPADSVPSGNLKPLAVFLEKRDWRSAGDAVDRVLEQSPDDSQALYWKSYILFQTASYRQSSTYALRYLERNQASSGARKILGLAYFMQGQPALAETELLQARDLAPSDFDVRYYLGRIQFERHNLPAALESFRAAVSLDPRSVKSHNHLGQTYEGLARFEEARAAYKQAIELDRQQPSKRSEWPYFNLGALALKEGDALAAATWLREALTLRPSWPEATVQLAASLGAANRLEEAKRLLVDLLAADPKNAQAHYQLARLLMKLRQPGEANRHFRIFAELKQP